MSNSHMEKERGDIDMRDNTVLTQEGIEVYENRVFELSDNFICNELQITPDDPDYQKIINKNFIKMIFYIRDRIRKPEHDIVLLDAIFDIFVRLCARCGRLPTLECFSFLVSIDRGTFHAWMNGEYRTGYSDTVKKWKETCKSFLIDDLNNSNTGSINKIFIAKAAYQMRETAPLIELDNTFNKPRQTREEIAAKYSAFKNLPEPEKPEFD